MRHSRRPPSHFERLLTHPPTQPLLHVERHALPIAAPKREREAAQHPLSGFDPTQDPEDCLRRYHAVQLAVQLMADPTERAAAQRRLAAQT